MKVEFHIKDIVISAKQKALIEKKVMKLKRYLKDEPMIIDIYLRDETSPEKGGTDQVVELSAVFGSEKIFVQHVDDRLMRSFAYAYKSFERAMSEFQRKRLDKTQKGSTGKIDRALRRLGIRK
ncbi:MAG: HPF/RaiA family ribosome-associated protein [Patescibacteria group bacterium]